MLCVEGEVDGFGSVSRGPLRVQVEAKLSLHVQVNGAGANVDGCSYGSFICFKNLTAVGLFCVDSLVKLQSSPNPLQLTKYSRLFFHHYSFIEKPLNYKWDFSVFCALRSFTSNTRFKLRYHNHIVFNLYASQTIFSTTENGPAYCYAILLIMAQVNGMLYSL